MKSASPIIYLVRTSTGRELEVETTSKTYARDIASHSLDPGETVISVRCK